MSIPVYTHIKAGVEYKFSSISPYFQSVFPIWEEETFRAFEQVKRKDKAALDIGAWIGTTAVWLSHHFSKVICIEGDQESVKSLESNLQCSNVKNAVIVKQPIHSISGKDMYFGPNKYVDDWAHSLNLSTSQIKDTVSSPLDYNVKTIALSDVPFIDDVGFIKCDIEGGEEFIIGDLIQFCKDKDSPILISFHQTWWTNRDVTRFASLFVGVVAYTIDTYEQIDNVPQHIQNNPFCTILFVPWVIKNLNITYVGDSLAEDQWIQTHPSHDHQEEPEVHQLERS
jgi:FkbM family methyltransferase